VGNERLFSGQYHRGTPLLECSPALRLECGGTAIYRKILSIRYTLRIGWTRWGMAGGRGGESRGGGGGWVEERIRYIYEGRRGVRGGQGM